jgi:hypothetical protein
MKTHVKKTADILLLLLLERRLRKMRAIVLCTYGIVSVV